MIFILNRLETIVAALSNSGDPSKITPYFEDTFKQDLTTGSETFEFTTLGNTSQASYITVGNFVAFNYNNSFKLFEIVEVEEEHEEAYLKKVYCETAGYELLNNPVRPRIIGNTDAKGLLSNLLEGTSWEVGNVQDTLQDIHSIEIEEYDTVYKVIQDLIVGKFSAEISYRVEFKAGKISKKYIDLYSERGVETGIRFDYRSNMDKVKRTSDISNLATALIGVGNDGITFKEIYANDKPSNQDFICSQEAYERWNVNGKHIIRTFEAETDSPGELLVLTRKELENRCKPHMTYEVNVNLLGQTVELGDTVFVIDNEFIPALQISARISKLEGSLSDPASGKCVLTNFKEITSGIDRKATSGTADDLQAVLDKKFPISSADIQDGAITQDKVDNKVITGITNKVETSVGATIDSKISTVTSDMDSKISTVTSDMDSKIRTVKSDIATDVAGQIDTAKTDLSSQITQSATAVELKFTNSGGSNLLKNTKGLNDTEGWTGTAVEVVADADFGSAFYSVDGGQITGNEVIQLKKGTDYIFEAWVQCSKTQNGTGYPLFFEVSNSVTTLDMSQQISTSNKWTKCYRHFRTSTTKDTTFIPIIKMSGTGTFKVTEISLTEGQVQKAWSQHPSEIYEGITSIDQKGVKISNTGSSNFTTIDSEGMDIQSAGKTVASFRLTTRIPELYADKIVSESIASKDEYYTEAFIRYYVNGTTGDDITGTGSDLLPFKSLQRAFDVLPDVVNTSTAFIVSGSIPSFRLYGKVGAGLIKIYLDQTVIVNGDIYIESMMNGVQLHGQNMKSTIKGQVVIDRCRHVDVSLLNFKMANSRANNVKITDTNTVLVSSCNMGYTTAGGSCIEAYGSSVYAYNNKGSNVTYYLSTTGFSTFTLPRSGTTTIVPSYSTGVIQYATGDYGTSRLLDGGTYTKTASDSYNPTYVASSKTNTFKPTSIYSSETLSGWADRPELTQGYYSAWSTGRWTGYVKFNDSAIRSTLSGATNLSGRLYLQRQNTSHGATTGTLKLYGSDGTAIDTATSFTRGQGSWISLSSTIVSKIQSGAIKYFYVKADTSSQATYIKFESNVVLEITYKN